MDFANWTCPLPLQDYPGIVIGHGGGGKLSTELVEHLFLPAFRNDALENLGDSSVLAVPAGRLAFSTDSFVVKPLFFPGGSIGDLAVNWTVNDISMSGARPLFLSAGFIIEEGFPMTSLAQIVQRMAQAAQRAGVQIVTGDTKVVEKGHGDGCYINTAGIGILPEGLHIGPTLAQPGDVVIGIASSGIHSNGMTLTRRVFFEQAGAKIDTYFPELGYTIGEELLRPTIIYVPEVLEILEKVPSVKALIHITGDGVLNLPRVEAEIGFVIDDLPPPPPLFGLIEKLGGVSRAEMFEVYNMGIGFCVIVAKGDADAALAILERHNRHASVIGHAVVDPTKSVQLPREKLVGTGKKFHPA